MAAPYEVWQHTRIVSERGAHTSSVRISTHANRYRARRAVKRLKRRYFLHFTVRKAKP